MTTSIVLLVLGAGWAAYLAVWFKDARKVSQDRTDMISSFSHGMGSLGGTTARPRSLTAAGFVLVPRSAGAAARRRREVAAFLGTLGALSFLAAFVFGPIALLTALKARKHAITASLLRDGTVAIDEAARALLLDQARARMHACMRA